MISPISANQIIANKTMVAPVAFRGLRQSDGTEEKQAPVTTVTSNTDDTSCEKLNTNFTGSRVYSLNGNKIDYFA